MAKKTEVLSKEEVERRKKELRKFTIKQLGRLLGSGEATGQMYKIVSAVYNEKKNHEEVLEKEFIKKQHKFRV